MNYELIIKNFFVFLFLIALIFIDQLSKYIICHEGGFYICNPNIAFGIQIPETIFWIFWLMIISIIILKLAKLFRGRGDDRLPMTDDKWLKKIALTLILAGALANMIDRVALGCVVDFIDLRTCLPVGMVWPVFNLADVFIVLGALILVAKQKKIW